MYLLLFHGCTNFFDNRERDLQQQLASLRIILLNKAIQKFEESMLFTASVEVLYEVVYFNINLSEGWKDVESILFFSEASYSSIIVVNSRFILLGSIDVSLNLVLS